MFGWLIEIYFSISSGLGQLSDDSNNINKFCFKIWIVNFKRKKEMNIVYNGSIIDTFLFLSKNNAKEYPKTKKLLNNFIWYGKKNEFTLYLFIIIFSL